MSAQLLLEELSELSKDLGPVFLSMARSIQMFDKETAARQLFEALPFSYAKDIGEFLAGWEDIPPSDLLNTVEVYRSALREDRLTRQKRRDETISDLVYFPVVVNSMVVLLNFIYVAYFLQHGLAGHRDRRCRSRVLRNGGEPVQRRNGQDHKYV